MTQYRMKDQKNGFMQFPHERHENKTPEHQENSSLPYTSVKLEMADELLRMGLARNTVCRLLNLQEHSLRLRKTFTNHNEQSDSSPFNSHDTNFTLPSGENLHSKDIREGLLVIHPLFGIGMVNCIHDQQSGVIDILFGNHGMMRVVVSQANLHRFDSDKQSRLSE